MEWPFWFLVVDDDDTELLRVQKCNLNKRSVKENAFFSGTTEFDNYDDDEGPVTQIVWNPIKMKVGKFL